MRTFLPVKEALKTAPAQLNAGLLMILDSPTFELVLTPEAALSIVQKEIQRRHWQKFEVEDIRLVYTPFYVFSFDVAAEGQAPSGKAAVNANTGEVDEFVPTLLERPLKKMRETDAKSPKAEVEATNVSRKEIESVAPAKVASAIGVKKDAVSVSAIAKYYLPFFRVWVTVPPETGESYKINVDALLGAPLGIDAIAGKQPGWEEEGEQTLDRLKTPKGWIELANETVSTLSHGGPGGFLSTPTGRWAALLVLIVILAFFVFRQGGVGIQCAAAQEFLDGKQYYVFGEQYLKPSRTLNGGFFVSGTCSFANNGKEDATSCARVSLKENGVPVAPINTSCAVNVPPGGISEKVFQLEWSGSSQAKYSLDFEKVV